MLEQGFEHARRWPATGVALHLETTGGRSERQRIVFIGLTRFAGGRIEETWETLVNPQARVPQHVTRRLDLDLEALDAAPLAPQALEEARSVIGDEPVVAHNALAQLGPLNYELLWHGMPALRGDTIDTQALASARFPDLARPSLEAIAGRLEVRRPGAAPHGRCRTVAEVYLRFGQIRQSVPELVPSQPPDADALAGAYAVPPGALPAELPALPGVYIFRDAAGAPLYVGKATSLRSRVPQHFTGDSRAKRLDDGLLARTIRVEHEVAVSERDARSREAALIAELTPPYNTQRAIHPATPWLILRDPPFVRAAAAAECSAEGESFGPYATSRAVRQTMRTLAAVFLLRTCLRKLPAKRAKLRVPCVRLGAGQCPAPCGELEDAEHYARRVALARTFLLEGKSAALDAVDAALCTCAEQWEHEQLAAMRSRLLRVAREHRPL